MLRIAVCDDENTVCSSLENFLLEVCNELHAESEVDVLPPGIC